MHTCTWNNVVTSINGLFPLYFQLHLTDQENAAFAVFVMLLARTIISRKLNLYIPISKVGRIDVSVNWYDNCYKVIHILMINVLCLLIQLIENMKTSQARGAVCTGSFYMHNDIVGGKVNVGSGCPQDVDTKLIDMDTIFNGKVGHICTVGTSKSSKKETNGGNAQCDMQNYN